MPIATRQFPFDPVEVLDYQFNWERWCSRSATSIASATVTVDAGLQVVGTAQVTGNRVTVFVRLDPDAPAPIGSIPQVHCTIVTAVDSGISARTVRRSLELQIVPR